MKNTRQRAIILQILKSTTSHPSADEVYVQAKNELPHISLGTVYRNLERLVNKGQIQKLEYSGGQKRFDGNPRFHCHFHCVSCNKVEDFPFEPASLPPNSDHPWIKARKILSQRIEFFGLCPDCVEQEKRSKPSQE